MANAIKVDSENVSPNVGAGNGAANSGLSLDPNGLKVGGGAPAAILDLVYAIAALDTEMTNDLNTLAQSETTTYIHQSMESAKAAYKSGMDDAHLAIDRGASEMTQAAVSGAGAAWAYYSTKGIGEERAEAQNYGKGLDELEKGLNSAPDEEEITTRGAVSEPILAREQDNLLNGNYKDMINTKTEIVEKDGVLKSYDDTNGNKVSYKDVARGMSKTERAEALDKLHREQQANISKVSGLDARFNQASQQVQMITGLITHFVNGVIAFVDASFTKDKASQDKARQVAQMISQTMSSLEQASRQSANRYFELALEQLRLNEAALRAATYQY